MRYIKFYLTWIIWLRNRRYRYSNQPVELLRGIKVAISHSGMWVNVEIYYVLIDKRYSRYFLLSNNQNYIVESIELFCIILCFQIHYHILMKNYCVSNTVKWIKEQMIHNCLIHGFTHYFYLTITIWIIIYLLFANPTRNILLDIIVRSRY
jgi:hypothetical protein